MNQSKYDIKTTRELGYINTIVKIPEVYRIQQNEHYMLPCANEYSMITLYDNPFTIASTIYGVKNLRKSVMAHLKRNRKYYATISTTYLNSKKLDYINWLSGMITKKLPADELCLHALATFMHIHITVDYLGGFWTTLNIPCINHNLAMVLSEIHLVYIGGCKFNLLCRNDLLKTLGRKILLHKIVQDLPKVTIVLNRINIPYITDKLDTSEGDSTDTDITEIYEHRPNDHKTVYPDSDSTVLYEIEEKELGIIYFETDKCLPIGKNKFSHQLYFYCPHSSCKFKSNRRKVTNNHYRRTHNIVSRCYLCRKTYTTPHSLTQHLYVHNKKDNGYLCKKCGRTFPFRSQLLIHKTRHTRKIH